jgi:hypothetical protein
VAPSKPNEQVIRLSDFVTLVNHWNTIAPDRSKELDSVEVELVEGPGLAIFVTEELVRTCRSLAQAGSRDQEIKSLRKIEAAIPQPASRVESWTLPGGRSMQILATFPEWRAERRSPRRVQVMAQAPQYFSLHCIL